MADIGIYIMKNDDESSPMGPAVRPEIGSHHQSSLIQRFIGRFRLRTVLTMSIVLVVLCVTGITWYLSFQNSQYAVNDLANQLMDEVSGEIAGHLDRYLTTPHLVNQICLDSIRLGEVDTRDNEALQRHFQELTYRFGTIESICYANHADGNYTIISAVGAPGVADGNNRFLGISGKETNNSFFEYLIDRNGVILEKTLTIPDYDPRTRPWYQSAQKEDRPVWTPVYMWMEGIVGLDAVVPVKSKDSPFLGVMDTSLTLGGIGEYLQAMNISKNGEAFIIDPSGNLIASSKIREPYKRVNDELVRMSSGDCGDPVIESAYRHFSESGHDTPDAHLNRQETFLHNGTRHYVTVSPYRDEYGLSWNIFVVIPESDFMEDITRNNTNTFYLFLIAVSGAVLLSIVLARWITDPILSMNRSAKALADGDWTRWKELDRKDELGELSHSFSVMADQLWKMFSSLKESREQYISLFQSSADALFLFEGLRLVNINRAGEDLLPVSREAAIGREPDELFGEIGPDIAAMIQEYLTCSGQEFSEHLVSRSHEGTEQQFNIRLSRIPEENKPLVLVQIRDISVQNRAIKLHAEQEALRDSYSRIRTILEFLPDPTFVIDKNGKVLFWNRALEHMTGITADQAIGKTNGEYWHWFYDTERPLLIDIALHPEIPHADLYPHLEKDGDLFRTNNWLGISGEKRYISHIASRIYGKTGEIIGAIESMRDITSHKIAEEAILAANKKLNLLSSITRHDILNKLMIAKAHIYLLEESGLTPEQNESIRLMRRSLEETEHFVNFTRTYQEIGVNLPAWQDLEKTCTNAASKVPLGAVALSINTPHVSILADPLFEKTCYNLIDNSLRHGDGLTRINISTRETDTGLVILFEDNGCGVQDDLKEIIFERGFGKNTGYGLFLTREILSMSGITIKETGIFGEGCRFEIFVPKGKYLRES